MADGITELVAHLDAGTFRLLELICEFDQKEEKLLQIALHGTASHVETQVRLYRKVKRIEALEEENLRHGHRELSWYIDDDGCWVLGVQGPVHS